MTETVCPQKPKRALSGPMGNCLLSPTAEHGLSGSARLSLVLAAFFPKRPAFHTLSGTLALESHHHRDLETLPGSVPQGSRGQGTND